MMPGGWLTGFIARLRTENVLVTDLDSGLLGPHPLLQVDAEDWGRCGEQAARSGLEWAGVWAEQQGGSFLVTACFAHHGERLLLRTAVKRGTPVLPSHTPHFPAADRMERHVQDLFGVAFIDHPDARRWTRHAAWPDVHFPLRREFPLAGAAAGPTPPDAEYRFAQAQGAGVCEIPVGPVHAGIIEPGHFRFQAVGEDILHMEARLGYVHKGVEKIAEGRDPHALARLAGRVSGDSTVAHAWAACMAMEQAARVGVPQRALSLRALMSERERIANHLGDIGALCNDVGFAFAHYQFSRLRELWLRASAAAFGHRLMMDAIIPGGVATDLNVEMVDVLRRDNVALQHELSDLYPILDDYPALEDRLVGTGVLPGAAAARLSAPGYVGRASGRGADLRRDRPYPPYDRLTVRVPTLESGDVAARLKIRQEEILVSLELIDRLLSDLPPGPIGSAWRTPPTASEGLGAVEGWRGEILSYVRFGASNRIARFFPRDPSWFGWPALEMLLHGVIVPDFPVCNKSVNASYSGQDL